MEEDGGKREYWIDNELIPSRFRDVESFVKKEKKHTPKLCLGRDGIIIFVFSCVVLNSFSFWWVME